MKKIFITVVIVIVGIAMLAKIPPLFLNAGIKNIKNMEIKSIDLGNISDGDYKGEFSKSRWSYKVDVKVKDHKIQEIKYSDNSLTAVFMKKIDDSIIKAIIEKQTPVIDAVSGATVNTKALSKAVEKALTKN
jgi:uncharacterized protein with FMN-binding domain